VVIDQNVRVITPDQAQLQLDYAINKSDLINKNEPIQINVQEIFSSVKFFIQRTCCYVTHHSIGQ